MEQGRIDRLNELARKQKAGGLTEEETRERAALREEYLASVRESLQAHLDNTYLVDEQGRKTKLTKREDTESASE